MALKEKSMLVSLNMKAWRARHEDRKITQKVLTEHNASKDAGSFTKLLVPKERIEPVWSAQSAARLAFYKYTLPWLDGATRILNSMLYPEFTQAMQRHRINIEQVTRVFVLGYPDDLAAAPLRLNGMYDRNDFPDPSRIADKFGFDIQIFPLADADDFRVQGLDQDEDEIRANIQASVQSRLTDTQTELYTRLLEVMKPFVQMAGKPKGKVYAVHFEHIREMVRLAPMLNLANDPKVDALCGQMSALIAGLTPDALREHPRIRAKKFRESKATLAEIEAAMAAFAA